MITFYLQVLWAKNILDLQAPGNFWVDSTETIATWVKEGHGVVPDVSSKYFHLLKHMFYFPLLA